MPLHRFQFSLRMLFYVVTAAAVYAALARHLGLLRSTVFFAGTGIVLRAARWRNGPKSVRIPVGSVGLVLIWFSAIEGVYVYDICDGCGETTCHYEYRILGVAVFEKHGRTWVSYLNLLARDFDFEKCHHEEQHRIIGAGKFGLLIDDPERPRYVEIPMQTLVNEGVYAIEIKPGFEDLLNADHVLRERVLRAMRAGDGENLSKLDSDIRNASSKRQSPSKVKLGP